jgi:hypothetical protein
MRSEEDNIKQEMIVLEYGRKGLEEEEDGGKEERGRWEE